MPEGNISIENPVRFFFSFVDTCTQFVVLDISSALHENI